MVSLFGPWLMLVALPMGFSQRLEESMFTKDSICGIQARTKQGCSKKAGENSDPFFCMAKCARDKWCFGASVDDNGTCFLHGQCWFAVDCSQENGTNTSHRYWSKYCVHGVWSSLNESCVCQDGSFGDRCDQYYKNCDDLISAGNREGFYRILINPRGDGYSPLKVVCYIKPPNYYNIRMVGNSGKGSFHRRWKDYVEGFYHDDRNLWGGLRTWSILTKETNCNNVGFKLLFKTRYGERYISYGYQNFVMQGEENHFSFWYSGTSYGYSSMPYSEIPNCLGTLQNVPFSTWDKNNLNPGGTNCAGVVRVGWWYDAGCDGEDDDPPCNLLGWGVGDCCTPRGQRFYFGDLSLDGLTNFDIFLTCS